jgi:hypothetical protein
MYAVRSHEELLRLEKSEEMVVYVARTRDVSALAMKTPVTSTH